MWHDNLAQLQNVARSWIVPNLSRFFNDRQPLVWCLAILIGIGAAALIILFLTGIGLVQFLWAGERDEIFLNQVQQLHWSFIFFAPVVGGLAVGLLLQHVLKRPRAGSVADVIEARHMPGRRLDFIEGLKSALVTLISLGAGASGGREGPAIHLGASFSSFVAGRFQLPDSAARTLLAAGAASAVSASFNAPIAGVLFAHEVILGHYAMRAFMPIVLASVAGSLVARFWYGDHITFIIPEYAIISYWEFPAFFLLGLVCALVAISFQVAMFLADYYAKNIDIPIWTRPVLGGLVIGAIGIFYPEIMGIGYETTNNALWGRLPVFVMTILLVFKIVATSVSLASRFGGGIFSPSLYLGALTGGIFGAIAVTLAPDGMASDPALYAILGMGAVAASVIGAPISTTVIAFELTGGYTLSIALLFTIAVSHGVNNAIHGRSFFQWQLEQRGLDVRDGPYQAIIRSMHVSEFMVEAKDGEAEATRLSDQPQILPLKSNDSAEMALQRFDQTGHSRLPVIDGQNQKTIIAWADYSAAIDMIHKRLVDSQAEEHR